MAKIIREKKGLDIPLKGEVANAMIDEYISNYYGVNPSDFPGVRWRPLVGVGDTVDIGTPLMHDKKTGQLNLVSPVHGKITEIRRGERRKILNVVIERSAEQTSIEMEPDFSTPESTRSTLCRYGLWALMRQRPYDIVAAPDVEIRDIFVTAFDSAPLAPAVVYPHQHKALEEGLRILSTLTAGKVYLGASFGQGLTSSYAEVTEYDGPHPVGNVGVQIAKTKPVNKGEHILTLDASTAVRIGILSLDKQLDMTTIVAITGPEVKSPRLLRAPIGAEVKALLDGELPADTRVRIISGNVLTGHRVALDDGFLRFPYRQVTVIAEGDNADEFMGWASMNPKKFSVKRTFPAFLRGLGRPYDFDARIKGGHRAMILSGEYDKVFPFDIYPEYLIKAIIAHDIDKMEKLGIYEVAPEDFALPEFVDTSKLPLQKIVREGLDYLQSESE